MPVCGGVDGLFSYVFALRELMAVCELVIKGLLQTKSVRLTKLPDFLDDQKMYHLYEKFILEYYSTKYRHLKVRTSASVMNWQVDDGF